MRIMLVTDAWDPQVNGVVRTWVKQDKYEDALKVAQTLLRRYPHGKYREAVAYYGKGFRHHPVGTGPFQLTEFHPTYRAVAQAMHEQISAVHPAIGAAMRHVDSSSEPRLER